jgi:hypothetical protein
MTLSQASASALTLDNRFCQGFQAHWLRMVARANQNSLSYASPPVRPPKGNGLCWLGLAALIQGGLRDAKAVPRRRPPEWHPLLLEFPQCVPEGADRLFQPRRAALAFPYDSDNPPTWLKEWSCTAVLDRDANHP